MEGKGTRGNVIFILRMLRERSIKMQWDMCFKGYEKVYDRVKHKYKLIDIEKYRNAVGYVFYRL